MVCCLMYFAKSWDALTGEFSIVRGDILTARKKQRVSKKSSYKPLPVTPYSFTKPLALPCTYELNSTQLIAATESSLLAFVRGSVLFEVNRFDGTRKTLTAPDYCTRHHTVIPTKPLLVAPSDSADLAECEFFVCGGYAIPKAKLAQSALAATGFRIVWFGRCSVIGCVQKSRSRFDPRLFL